MMGPLPGKLEWLDADKEISVYQGDSLQWMDSMLADGLDIRFDAIIADPPYFLSNGGVTCHSGAMVRVDKGTWDESHGPESNHAFNHRWLDLCKRLLKPNGTIWISGTHHVIFSIGYALQQLEFKILNHITWEKPNPPPNLSCRYLTHSTESILWAARDAYSKHIFNYQEMRRVSGKQMKTVWRAPEFPLADEEMPAIWSLLPPGSDEKTLGRHPTQKPITLIERFLLASTNPGDLIFDPFLGGGTTAIAALRTGRRCIGVEMDPTHIQLAIRRLEACLRMELPE